MFHSSLLKGTLKGLRIHSGKRIRKIVVCVSERYESFSQGHRNELLSFHRPLQGGGKGGKYACVGEGGVVVLFIFPEVITA